MHLFAVLGPSHDIEFSNKFKKLLMNQTGCRDRNLDFVFIDPSHVDYNFAIQPAVDYLNFPDKIADALKSANFTVQNNMNGDANCGWKFLGDLDCGTSNCGTLFWRPNIPGEEATPEETATTAIRNSIQDVSMKYLNAADIAVAIALLIFIGIPLLTLLVCAICKAWSSHEGPRRRRCKIWPNANRSKDGDYSRISIAGPDQELETFSTTVDRIHRTSHEAGPATHNYRAREEGEASYIRHGML